MERLTYDFCIGGNHCWQVKGADNLECREVCERQGDDGCKTCPIAKAFDRLAAIEDILGDEYDLDLLQKQIQEYREGRYIITIVNGQHRQNKQTIEETQFILSITEKSTLLASGPKSLG